MLEKGNFKIPNIYANQREKLMKLRNQYLNPGFPVKRNSLSSKTNNNTNVNNQGTKVNIAELLDINKKGYKVPDNAFSYRSSSLNKPDSRSSSGLNSREAYKNNFSNLPPQIPPPINSDGYKIANFPPSIKNRNLVNGNIHNIKFDGTIEDKEEIIMSNQNNQLFHSFKNLNHVYNSNNSKFQKININNRNILSGNAASNNKNHYVPIQDVKVPKHPINNNLFSNSISINHLDINKINNNRIVKKPNTTTKIETTSNFFFSSPLLMDFAFKEEQNSGCRKTMEDTTKIVDNFQGDKEKLLFCVFDGHGGFDVAKKLKEKLPEELIKKLLDPKITPETAFASSFKSLDNEFKKFDNIGSTACIVYITKEKDKKVFYCANVGDTACILIKSNKAVKISYDHKCTDTKENERIKSSGGIIFGGRVFGQLAITRSFGDYALKNYGVCPLPFVSKNIIQEEDKYLVIASDGVWDVVDLELAHQLSTESSNADELCKILVKNAMSLGSIDNISCITIRLN